MKISLTHKGRTYTTDLGQGTDLSSKLGAPGEELKAWHAEDVRVSPVKSGDWVGSVKEGAPINFFNIRFNPHGNGSHTETVGHISPEKESVNTYFNQHHLVAYLLHLPPKPKGEDEVVRLADLQDMDIPWEVIDALIIRTGDYGPGHDFSGTNAPFFEPELMTFIRKKGIQHFLTDLPSVDPEEDGGQLLSHRAFWNYPENRRLDATISELLRIPAELPNRLYLLNLQTAAFENDAAPCRPVVFRLEES